VCFEKVHRDISLQIKLQGKAMKIMEALQLAKEQHCAFEKEKKKIIGVA
jgi:hypothetical protein